MCECKVTSVMSNSLWTYGVQPARILCPGDSPGKNTGVGFCALLQGSFLTQGWSQHSLSLLHWQVGSLPRVPRGKPHIKKQSTAINKSPMFHTTRRRNCINIMLGENTDTKEPKLYDSIFVNFNKWEKLNDDDRNHERLQQELRDEWCHLGRGLREPRDDDYDL